jgi:hypothetical protein
MLQPPAEEKPGSGEDDLFSDEKPQERRVTDEPSNSVFVDEGREEDGTVSFVYAGEIQLDGPMPTEIMVQHLNFRYIFKLDRREKGL